MSYQALASYYDLLINEEDAQKRYCTFVLTYLKQKESILELACGSGTLAHLLKEENCHFKIDASDLSPAMIEVAKTNYPAINFFNCDMREFNLSKTYDAILCFCDSINYLLVEKEMESMFRSVYRHLNDNGIFLFDAHSLDRLVEFKDEYDETNNFDDLEYTWHIKSVDDYIYQTLRVWDDNIVPTYFFEEKHEQRVYNALLLKSLLEKIGFAVEILTDFEKVGIVEGEKQFFICRKEVSE